MSAESGTALTSPCPSTVIARGGGGTPAARAGDVTSAAVKAKVSPAVPVIMARDVPFESSDNLFAARPN
jgi:hypothetical protein